MAIVITIINYDHTVIRIVNYDPKTLAQATGSNPKSSKARHHLQILPPDGRLC